MSVLVALATALALAQAALAARVLARLAATAGGSRIAPAPAPPHEPIAVLVPVLDEARRIDGCLDRLRATGPEVIAILVVDGGSRDATRERVAQRAARDPRVRLVEAGPAPASWNGKAHGLHQGVLHADPRARWILALDADVRIEPWLPGALVAHARREGVEVLSAAVRQRLPSAAQALLHPALLSTLVVRLGIPGHATRDPARVQANGQCWLARHALLSEARPFAAARDSLCEDVTAARVLARRGVAVGFYEAGDAAEVTMYDSSAELVRGWPRSLPLIDGEAGTGVRLGWAEMVAVQGLVLPGLAFAAVLGAPLALAVEAGLVAARLAILAGTARAYVARPVAYWLSPLADPVAVALVLASARRRRHRWRGRLYERRADGRVRAIAEDER